jgi:hypothetical protein
MHWQPAIGQLGDSGKINEKIQKYLNLKNFQR